MSTPCSILACSPRKGGNTDSAADLFATGVARALDEKSVETHRLRDYRVSPCIACDACREYAVRLGNNNPTLSEVAAGPKPGRAPFGCPLARNDNSASLLRLLAEPPLLCLVAPVYFYHLPAQLKALLDRTQPFWNFARAGVNIYAGQARRRCHVILVGARPSGKRLFAGSLLTIRYALKNLHAELDTPLTFYGLDSPEDLRKMDAAEQRAQIEACGEAAGRAFAQARGPAT